jgi:acetylornithine deacetylase/succinyl-diaminopimelate desuccinylase-like protein
MGRKTWAPRLCGTCSVCTLGWVSDFQEENVNKSLQEAVKTQTQNFRGLIEDYCRLESVSAQARMMQETADWVEALLQDTGFETQQIEVDGAPNYVYGEQKGSSDFTLLLYNHYDVQPEDPINLWESPPFEVTEWDGKLFARGIADNRAELIARVCALKALLAAHGELPITLRWIIEGEEEVGSPHFDAMSKLYGNLLEADGAFWEGRGFAENGQAQIYVGFLGMLYVEFSVEAMKQDAHSGSASALPSAAWRLLKALSRLRDDEGRNLIPGFYDDARQPTESEEAALHSIVDPELEEKVLAMYGIEAFKDNKRGYEYARLVFEPTTNIAGLLSGYTEKGVKTVLPAKAMAKMDFRLVPDQKPDDILEKLRAHLKAQGFGDVTVKKLVGSEPVVTPIDSELVQRINQICKDFTDQETRIGPLAGGTLPLLEAMKKNVGILGLSTVGNPVYYGSGAHAPNENIRLDDVARAVEFNALVFEELGADAPPI